MLLDIEFILLFCDSVHQRKYYIAGLNFFSMYLQYKLSLFLIIYHLEAGKKSDQNLLGRNSIKP